MGVLLVTVFRFDEAAAPALLEALRLYEGRLAGSGRRFPLGLVEIRAAAERSVRATTVQRQHDDAERADNEVVTQLLTRRDVEVALQTSESTVKRLLASGELPSVHVGRNVRVRPADLQTFINDLATTASEATRETAS